MKKVAIISLSRSDYASVKPVALAVQDDDELEMMFVAGGSHCLTRFGNTIDVIEDDGIAISHRIEFLDEDSDTVVDIASAQAKAIYAFTELFIKDRPEIVFILGDRWEMISAAIVASALRIPICHHSGGDITQGSADNQTRYVLSTLSHLHCVALDQHKDRLLKMGEEDWRVTVTGEPALTKLHHEQGEFSHQEPFILATFHPTSYDDVSFENQIEFFIDVLDLIESKIILTAPNPDQNSGAFYKRLKQYSENNPNIKLVESLGTQYYAAMRNADIMIGNSSSGLWEAPSFALPVINIGKRQQDRIRGSNVIDIGYHIDEAKDAIQRVKNPDFLNSLSGCENPYFKHNTIELILEQLKTPICSEKLLAKHFIDPIADSHDIQNSLATSDRRMAKNTTKFFADRCLPIT